MTTTLHGLVTISELFAGFNLINTGVLNCLIMCQNARKMHHSEAKKIPHPLGALTPRTSAPLAPRASRLRRSTLPPQTKVLDPPVNIITHADDSCGSKAFSGVCVSVCFCVYVFVRSITKERMIQKSSNLV